MITISLCMIVKNEQEYLGKCLESVKEVMDEIIIVDTGSTDQTKVVAAKYTDKIYDFAWQDDFSLARNYSFSKASKEYIMWLDADDILMPDDRQKLLQLKEKISSDVDAIYMKYHLGMGEDGKAECTFWRERLVRREKNFQWHDPVHEYLLCEGKIIKADVGIVHTQTHYSVKRNIEIFRHYMAKGNKLTHRQCYYYARELYLEKAYDQAIQYYKAFLQEEGGLRANYMTACIDLAAIYEERKESANCLKALLYYFQVDRPRAEICCALGDYYKARGEYEKAIEWFKLAPYTTKPEESIGAVMPKFWDYVPYMELCACYYKMGNFERAIYYNEEAAAIRPDDSKILHNRCFLAEEYRKYMSKE